MFFVLKKFKKKVMKSTNELSREREREIERNGRKSSGGTSESSVDKFCK